MRTNLAPGVLLFLFLFAAGGAAGRPLFVYLTWRGDPATTMTVCVVLEGPPSNEARVRYGTEPGAHPDEATAAGRSIEGLPGRTVHAVEIEGLEPGRTYYFVAGDGAAWSQEMKFRTIAIEERPLRFVVGGDMGTAREMRDLLERAAACDPHFAVIGGDIAYANGDPGSAGLWDQWLGAWGRRMVTPEGYSVPIVAAIGNHEVDGGFGRTAREAPFYSAYLDQAGGRTYFSRTFGRVLTLYVLDSGHIAPHGGEQRDWLAGELSRPGAARHRMAVYHVPLYPSVRAFEGEHSERGRRAWGPLFDEHRLEIAFENHDHALKRTQPLVAGQPTAGGTIYLGDGCWGQTPREVEPDRPYLVRAEASRHFWLVAIEGRTVEARAIDAEGEVLDRLILPEGAREILGSPGPPLDLVALGVVAALLGALLARRLRRRPDTDRPA